MNMLRFLLIILFLSACTATAPKVFIPPHEPPKTHLKKLHPEVILVLGSGSARGFAHAGVLKMLEKNHIPIDMIIGTSAGSIVGALYADHPSSQSLQRILLNTPRHEVIDFSLMNIMDGPVSGNGLQNFLVKSMKAQTFEKLTIPFLAVATNLHTGQAHVFASGPVAPAVNASSAAPPFFRPVKLYGSTYVDGGIIDPVAVDVAKQFHPKIIIAVSLNFPLPKDLPTRSPSVFLRSFDIMLMKLNNFTAGGADVVITPSPKDIDMFEDSKRDYLMRTGEVAAEKMIPTIKKLLASHHISLKKQN